MQKFGEYQPFQFNSRANRFSTSKHVCKYIRYLVILIHIMRIVVDSIRTALNVCRCCISRQSFVFFSFLSLSSVLFLVHLFGSRVLSRLEPIPDFLYRICLRCWFVVANPRFRNRSPPWYIDPKRFHRILDSSRKKRSHSIENILNEEGTKRYDISIERRLRLHVTISERLLKNHRYILRRCASNYFSTRI